MNIGQAMLKVVTKEEVCGGNVTAAMRMAQRLAANGLRPQDRVGAVVLNVDGAVIGKGWNVEGEQAAVVALQDCYRQGYKDEEISTVVATHAPDMSVVERLLMTSCECIVFDTPTPENEPAMKWIKAERAWVQL